MPTNFNWQVGVIMEPKKFIIWILAIALLPAIQVRGQEQEVDLSSAFNSIKLSMGSDQSNPSTNSNKALDSALEEAFTPIPAPVIESIVYLDDVDGPRTGNAIKEIAQIPVDNDFTFDYREKGM